MEDQHIVIADCCMKQEIKKFSDFLVQKPMTDREVLVLAIYQLATNILIDLALIQFKVAYRLFVWLLYGVFSNNVIFHLAIFLNFLILIQIVENIKEFVHTMRCQCDYREHPELHEE
jgi:hypothetical protein